MAALSSWAGENWFNVVQSVGILASLLLAAAAAHREAKAREIENLLTIAQQHRELWSEARLKPELHRVFLPDTDAISNPASVAEEEFLNLAITHFQTGLRIAKAGGVATVSEWEVDARSFFSLPLPRSVWEKTKGSRNTQFVRKVERALGK